MNKIPARKIKQYYKRFANGEQYIELNPVTGEIVNQDKQYYWQHQRVYNKIKPMIRFYCNDISENEIYGRNGLVSLLEPWQRMYNDVMNQYNTKLNLYTNGFMLVEDGSIDVDDLSEEGLAPGKVLVYRQGSNAPSINNTSVDVDTFLKTADYCTSQMYSIVDTYVHNLGYSKEEVQEF
jgi:hypothetical protein